jgi:hypothetical protein
VKPLAKQLPICPRCGQPGSLLDEPAGHEVREAKAKTWEPAKACIKCVDEIRTGGSRRKKKAANDTRPRKRMTQIELFKDDEPTTTGSK